MPLLTKAEGPSLVSTAESAEMAARITELEIKFSYAEDLLDALNQTVYLQQQQIDLLQRELKALREHWSNNAPNEPLSVRDELPPHY